MTLRKPLLVPGTHIRPFGYEVILNNQTLGRLNAMVSLQSISYSYDIEDNRCYFNMWDPAGIENVVGTPATMPIPSLTDDIEIVATDGQYELWWTIFRGKLDGVTTVQTSQGRRFNCTAMSNVRRLNESLVTMSCNQLNDPFYPSPVFDPETGVRVEAKKKTVAEIIRQIMRFPNAWGVSEYFEYDDIDWGGLESNSACGSFVPSNVSFQNTRKGEAIQEVLQMAGSYRLHYDPHSDTLRVIELNLKCNRCGPQYPITFTEPTPDGNGTDYAQNLQIISDKTEWSSRASANVVRVSSGRIRYYSGNYIIPEMVENVRDSNGNEVNEANRLRAVEQDTVLMQKARAVNPEGVFYRFQPPYNIFEDHRKYPQYTVGLPLFPDWNVFEDFLPDVITIPGVQVQAGNSFPTGKTEADYITQAIEYVPITRGQQIAMGLRRLSYPNNLLVWQAWHIKEPCPACEGTGSVAAIYSGGSNAPEITWTEVAGGKTKRHRVTNYIFDPAKFGVRDPDTGELYPHDGLTKFVASGSQPYPIPWKNLCPYCRGVGWKPEYKIRNIMPDLVKGRAVVVGDGEATNVPIDPEYTQTEPETWEDSTSRVLLNWPAYVQVEHGFASSEGYRLPSPLYDAQIKNKPWKSLADYIKAHPQDSVQLFQHPLRGYKKQLATMLSITGADANLVPDSSDWNAVHGVYTEIDVTGRVSSRISSALGQVIFSEPQFIPCSARFATVRINHTNHQARFLLAKNGLIDTTTALGGNSLVDDVRRPRSFWRPARVWAQFFYTKENFYDTPAHERVAFTYTNPEGETKTYYAKYMIVDGCWVADVYKADPATWGETEVEFGNHDRMVMSNITDLAARIETTEEDLELMPIPPTADPDPAALETIKRNAGLKYPRLCGFRWDQPAPGEKLYEMEGLSVAQAEQALARPRFYTWRPIDDRPKLLAKAARKLETDNDLQVQGSLDMRGMLLNMEAGLGWVDYPNKGRAAVVKVTQNFGQGFTTTAELTRAEARQGQLPPDDKITMVDLAKEVRNLRADYDKNKAETPMPTEPMIARGTGAQGYTGAP